MSVIVNINGTNFQIPQTAEVNWGDTVTAWMQAVSSHLLQKTGGAFALSSEVDFGGTAGLKTLYYKTRATNPASAGQFRLGNAEVVAWRNQANSGNKSLTLASNDWLQFESVDLADISTAQTLTNKVISGASNTISNVAYSSLVLTGSIVDADINAAAAIALSKLATVTASRALQSSAGGVVEASSVTATELGYLSGVTSSIQSQINAITGSGITALTGDVTASGPGSVAATIQNGAINNAKVAAGAAIALSKLAAVTASRLLVSDGSGVITPSSVTSAEAGYLSGVTSAIQTQIDSKAASSALTSHTGASTGVHGITGAVVGTTDTQSLSAKTLVAPVVDDGADFIEEASLSSPSAGRRRLGLKTDGKLYLRDSSGNESVVGSGSGGGTNYISNPNADTDTTGWSTGRKEITVTVNSSTEEVSADDGYVFTEGEALISFSNVGGTTAGTTYYAKNASGTVCQLSTTIGGSAVNLTGGSPAYLVSTQPKGGTNGTPSITWTRTTSSPLSGLGSFLLTKSQANRAGDYVYFDFSIDRQDLAKPLAINFSYEVASGTYADGDLAFWILDVTNSRLIQPSASTLLNAVGPQKKQTLNFQTSSDSTSYRLIQYTTSSSAVAYTVKFDSFSVGPQVTSTGSYAGYLGALTTTGSWTTNTTYTAHYWRTAEGTLKAEVTVSLAGAPNSASLTVNLPSGLVADSTRLSEGSPLLGVGQDVDAGVGRFQVQAIYESSTTVGLYYANDTGSGALRLVSGSINQANPQTFASGDRVSFHYEIPIVGWSSSVQLSSDADTRVVAARYSTAAGQSMANGASTLIDFGTKTRDTHGAVTTGGSWKFTAPVPGIYSVSALTVLSSGGGWAAAEEAYLDVYKNGSFATRLDRYYSDSTHTARVTLGNSDEIDLSAGDYIDIRLYQSSGAAITLLADAASNYVNVSRISGPAQIAQSEAVVFSGRNAAGTGFAGVTTIPFATVDVDTHGGYSAGVYTVKTPGIYEITSTVMLESQSWTQGSEFVYRIMIDGSTVRAVEWIAPRTATQYSSSVTATAVIRLNVGQTINFAANQTETGANRNLITSGSSNMASIKRIG